MLGLRPTRAAETAVLPECAAIEDGLAVAVEPYEVVVPSLKLTVVVVPLSLKVPFRVELVVTMLSAAMVEAAGAVTNVPNFCTSPQPL